MLKTVFRTSFVLCFVLAASRSIAQQASQPAVTLPVLGFVLDQTGGLRPVIGITGSASVGAPLDLGFGIVRASMPPNHDYILAMAAGSSRPVLLQVRGNTVTSQSINSLFNNSGTQPGGCDQSDSPDDFRRPRCRDGSSGSDRQPAIDNIALSPTGSIAGLFSQSQGRIYAISNLSQSPALLGTFDVSALGNASAFGISDDGQTAVFGASDGSVYLLNTQQAPRLIASIHHPSAIQFLRNSYSAIIGDDIDNTIYELSNGQMFAIASANDGISTPSGIGTSNDNQKVFIGNSGAGSVTTISLNGTGTASISCNCTLSGLRPTSADSVFQLTDFSGTPILLFDGSSTTPRMIFVPVGAQF